MHLSIECKRLDTVLIVRLAGELDHHTSQQVREEIEEQMTTSTTDILLLNLAELNFMDSSGLGVILGRYKSISQSGGKLLLCSLTTAIARLVEMSGLRKILAVYADEQTALGACEVVS